MISAFTPSVVNEFRYSMTYWSNTKDIPTASICPSPCIGLGGPQFTIHSVGGFQIGNNGNTPTSAVLRRHIFADNITLQKGAPSLKLGGEWEYQQGTGSCAYAEPGGAVLYSPEDVQGYNAYITSVGLGAYAIKIPSSFTTYRDLAIARGRIRDRRRRHQPAAVLRWADRPPTGDSPVGKLGRTEDETSLARQHLELANPNFAEVGSGAYNLIPNPSPNHFPNPRTGGSINVSSTSGIQG